MALVTVLLIQHVYQFQENGFQIQKDFLTQIRLFYLDSESVVFYLIL